ncbi:hypothetical protein [Pseudoalteromonas rhizosphaerae]|uniref:hypothetical protein n=1 Tax=Pseudoalteromonas rhizosphaerae TaxID=2518973 RepID=UPI002148B5D0|nr:hypothetical protein [Pseudoalteromonas rhizosphaerae]
MKKNRIFILAMSVILASGCSNLGKKNVLFVTKTSLGVDVDSTPPAIDVGYARKEGTVAPVFEDGQVLSQMAAFSTKQGLVNQAAGQSFATGNAAELMTKYLISNATVTTGDTIGMDEVLKIHTIKRKGEPERYFFGTDMSFGLKVGLAVENGGMPDSLSLGYKRKESTFVPLIEKSVSNNEVEVALPSLISTSGFENQISSSDSSLLLRQFFATGNAANYLASIAGIRQEVVPKMIPGTEELVSFVRERGFTESKTQQRIEKLLIAVDSLDDNTVYSINKTPPLVNPAADNIINQMDPACQRLSDRDCNSDGTPDFGGTGATGNVDIAKRMLKFRVVMSGKRSEAELASWEAVIKAN